MGLIESQLSFCKNRLGIKLPTKVDMLLKKETKPNQTNTVEFGHK